MAKTKSIRFSCEKAEVSGNGSRSVIVDADFPAIEDLLSVIDKDELVNYVYRNFEPEDIFPSPALEKWAEAEGYVKGGDE